jgi:hypothetical protein
MHRKTLLLLLLASIVAHPACAQDAAPSGQDTSPDLAQLLEKIRLQEAQLKQLESEVAQLKAAQESKNPAPDASSSVAPNDATVAPTAASGQEPAAAPPVAQEPPTPHEHTMSLPGGGPSLKIRAFGDVNLGLGSDANPLIFPLPQPVHNTFEIGEFDLFLSSRLSRHVSGISEIVIGSDPTNFWGLDIERLQITYKANPYFEISAGRYHTSIGYYNTAFHHGTWFQTATGRPFQYYFEDSGGLLPVHSVGVTSTGLVPHTGALELHWVAEVGNGRNSDPNGQPVQNFLSDKNHKDFNLAAYIKPQWLPGVQIGGSYYRDRLVPVLVPHVDEGIGSFYVVYINSAWEIFNEAEWMNHKSVGLPKTYNTPFAFTQVSRKFGVYRPYFRFQYVNVPADDPFNSFRGRYEGPSFGLRMDFTEYAALKTQYNRLYQRGVAPENGVDMQVAFTF